MAIINPMKKAYHLPLHLAHVQLLVDSARNVGGNPAFHGTHVRVVGVAHLLQIKTEHLIRAVSASRHALVDLCALLVGGLERVSQMHAW